MNLTNGITISGGVTLTVPASGGGGGPTTYTNSSTTFLGSGDGPGDLISSLYNGGTWFKIVTASSPSAEFVAAINALTTGSVFTIVDANDGPITVTLTSGFNGTFTTNGFQSLRADCTATAESGFNITSITI